MTSTYTTDNGIEKPATGDRSGTWGTMVNSNMDLVDQALDGFVSVTAAATGSTGSPNTLPITNGSVSNGRNRIIHIVDGGDLGGTVYYQVTPNDAEKWFWIKNGLTASRAILLFQGTYNASNDLEIPNGKTCLVRCNGAGSGAVVSYVTADSQVTGSLAVDNLLLDGNTISSTDSNGAVTITPNGTGDVNLGADTVMIGDNNADATLTTNGTGDLTLSTNSGTNAGTIVMLDGVNTDISVTPHGTGNVNLVADTVVVGDSGAAATVTSSGTGDLILSTNSGTDSGTITITDAANQDISIVPHGTGNVNLTADSVVAGDSNADFTLTTSGTGDLILNTNTGTNAGTVTLFDGADGNIALTPNGTGEVDISKVDIAAGAIDGTTVGAASASTGAFTTLSATNNVSFNGGTFIFNEAGADKDFRVESDGNQYMVFVDGGNNKVAIGTATATATLTVAGSVKPTTYQETYVAAGAAATITLDLATGTSFSTTMDEDTTFAFSNPPTSGTAFSFTLIVTQHSTAVTITWPGGVDWAGGSAPDAAGDNEVQAYAFITRDAGTTYYGFLGGTAIG